MVKSKDQYCNHVKCFSLITNISAEFYVNSVKKKFVCRCVMLLSMGCLLMFFSLASLQRIHRFLCTHPPIMVLYFDWPKDKILNATLISSNPLGFPRWVAIFVYDAIWMTFPLCYNVELNLIFTLNMLIDSTATSAGAIIRVCSSTQQVLTTLFVKFLICQRKSPNLSLQNCQVQ